MRRSPLARRTGLKAGKPLGSRSQLRRTRPIKTRPRRQAKANPFPMTCPPGFRDAMLEAAGYRCERCGGTAGLTLSHRCAAGRRAPFVWWNINVLCWDPCHAWCEENPAAAVREGWRVSGAFERRGLAWAYVGPDAEFAELVSAALAGAA